MKVRCHNIQNRKHLTDGKIYDVFSKEGDESKIFTGCHVLEGGFEIVNDTGSYSYCLLEDCSHAKWEIVE